MNKKTKITRIVHFQRSLSFFNDFYEQIYWIVHLTFSHFRHFNKTLLLKWGNKFQFQGAKIIQLKSFSVRFYSHLILSEINKNPLLMESTVLKCERHRVQKYMYFPRIPNPIPSTYEAHLLFGSLCIHNSFVYIV